MAYCILGGIKETVGMLSRGGQSDITRLVEDILSFGLGGVAQPELLEVLRNTPAGSAKVESGGPAAKAVFFVGQN
jgi:hypothetical protein